MKTTAEQRKTAGAHEGEQPHVSSALDPTRGIRVGVYAQFLYGGDAGTDRGDPGPLPEVCAFAFAGEDGAGKPLRFAQAFTGRGLPKDLELRLLAIIDRLAGVSAGKLQ